MLQSFSANRVLRPIAIALALGGTLVFARPAGAVVCKATGTVAFARAASQAAALSDSKSAWRAAVISRYGVAWSIWKAAAGQSQVCSHPSDWICYASARPCRGSLP
jgi:hypothetical protein